MSSFSFSSVVLTITLPALLFAQEPNSGQPAPPLTLDQTIPAAMEASWEGLRGRPVVLEFWATWCANCVAEIPKLNELAAKFPQVQFISITDEAASAVAPFLAKRPISGWVAFDRQGATFKAYGVEGRPRTFLIGADGVIRAAMHPEQVDGSVLADLAADRPVKPRGLRARLQVLDGTKADPVFAMMLRPAETPKPGGLFAVDAGRMEGTNIPLKTIVAYAFTVPEARLEGPEVPLRTRYDFCVLLPDGVGGDTQLLREMLERSFRLKTRRDPRTMDAAVLRLLPGSPHQRTGVGRMQSLARMLESRLGKPVVDETGLDSFQFFELPKEIQEISEALRTRLGVELVLERRPVDFLVIEALELPTFRMGPPAR